MEVANASKTLETSETAEFTAAGRTAAGAGSTSNGATTEPARAALTLALAAVAGGVNPAAADGAMTDLRLDSAEARLEVSLIDAAATGRTLFTEADDG